MLQLAFFGQVHKQILLPPGELRIFCQPPRGPVKRSLCPGASECACSVTWPQSDLRGKARAGSDVFPNTPGLSLEFYNHVTSAL